MGWSTEKKGNNGSLTLVCIMGVLEDTTARLRCWPCTCMTLENRCLLKFCLIVGPGWTGPHAQSFWFSKEGWAWDLRTCNLNKFPGDTVALETTLWESKDLATQTLACRPATWHHLGACERCRVLSPILDLLKQNLHLSKIRRWLVSTGKFEKHHFRKYREGTSFYQENELQGGSQMSWRQPGDIFQGS